MSINRKNSAIGVFDSGLGGLTVVKELIHQLPSENIVYFGDTARVPYGTKSKETIIRFSQENTMVLLDYRVKMIVVACNSSSSYAISNLERTFNIPIIGVIGPGSQKAAENTKNGRVGVIATSATIASGKYDDTIRRIDKNIKVFSKACPMFVPLVEQGWIRKKVTEDIALEYLIELKNKNVDTLILGCTHYPLLKEVIQKVMGGKVSLIDSAETVAAQVRNILEKENITRTREEKPRHRFIVSDKPQNFKDIANTFLGYSIKDVILRK
ncbi:MAG: glutamate racemase [Candidatus Omnitrophica bacterium]|nr:glutamate racemase [Candidatus Omnitrophota bacterium]